MHERDPTVFPTAKELFGAWTKEPNFHWLAPWLDRYPWELVASLQTVVQALLSEGDRPNPKLISPTAIIKGDVYIGNNVYIGDFALVRGPAILLDSSIIGHASEVIHSLIGPGSRVTHKNSIGHCLLGRDVNLGACVTIASVGIKNPSMNALTEEVHVRSKCPTGNEFNTGMLKFGAAVGDRTKVGMNASLGPGVILLPDTMVMPNLYLKSFIYGPHEMITERFLAKIKKTRQRYGAMNQYADIVDEIFGAYRMLRADQILERTGGAVSRRASDGNIVISATGSARRGWNTVSENVTVITPGGEKLSNENPLGVSGTPLHLAIYSRCPDANAVVHAHAPYSLAYAACGVSAPNTINLMDAIGEVPCLRANDKEIKEKAIKSTDALVVPSGIVQRPDVYAVNMRLIEEFVSKMSDRCDNVASRPMAFLIEKHGLVAVGRDLYSAMDAALRLESSCRTAILSRLVREPGRVADGQL